MEHTKGHIKQKNDIVEILPPQTAKPREQINRPDPQISKLAHGLINYGSVTAFS